MAIAWRDFHAKRFVRSEAEKLHSILGDWSGCERPNPMEDAPVESLSEFISRVREVRQKWCIPAHNEFAPLDWISNTPFGLLQESYRGIGYWPERRSFMDTMTYASVAMLPKSIVQDHTHFVRQDLELLPLDLSLIKR
jgi:hypothetical protein